MTSFCGVSGFILANAIVACAITTDASPLNKVFELLEGLLAKGQELKSTEEKQFAETKALCDTIHSSTAANIKRLGSKMVQLQADIEAAETDVRIFAGEIEDLNNRIVEMVNGKFKATKVRRKEHHDFKASHNDISESINAIDEAVGILKHQDKTIPQAKFFAQLSSDRRISARAKVAIASFLEMGATPQEEASGYQFQSRSVITILEQMKLKFEDMRVGAEKEETFAQANFEHLNMQWTEEIEFDKKVKIEKVAKKADRLQSAESAKGELIFAQKGKSADEVSLGESDADCSLHAKEYERNQVLRAEELNALKTAVGILKSDEVKGSAQKHLPAMLLQRRARHSKTILLQFGSHVLSEEAVRHRVTALLRSQGQKLNSRHLSLIATRTEYDPFRKVKHMIKELIVRLMEEANAEADHKAYCDSEVIRNKQTRTAKADEIEDMTASIEISSADSLQLTDDIGMLSKEMKILTHHLAEATKLRNEEHAKNSAIISDAKQGELAVSRALQTLKEYYYKASDSSMLQDAWVAQNEIAQTMKNPYMGMRAEASTVLSMIEIVLTDFASLEASASSAEEEAQASFEKFSHSAELDIATKTTEMEHKVAKKEQIDVNVHTMKASLELVKNELDTLLEYLEKLRPTCLDAGLSYTERSWTRQKEIESLQEALKIIDGQSPP